MSQTLVSSMAIHPGEMIKDEIVARGLTQRKLAEQMDYNMQMARKDDSLLAKLDKLRRVAAVL